MKYLRALLSLLVAGGLTYLLNRPLGPAPALGPFFSPFTGFWQNNNAPQQTVASELKLQGLKGEVTVKYDDNGVPHIFAENDEDLFFAQGYIIARDRLWQMDFYTRVTSGRLSEVMGPLALDFDRYNRRLQLPEGAAKLAEAFMQDPVSKMVAESYSAGINAYITQVDYKDLAIEFKILGYKPEAWSPLKTALVEMLMRKDMNARSDDYRMSNTLAKHGKEVVNDLFPDYPVEESPIVPKGTRWDFTPVAIPKVPEMLQASVAARLDVESENPGIGSNNWAVHGSRTATGLPLLSNDPHLGLSLPSIWYQMQLVSPTVNVYGVCVPGWPGIGIGFNKDVAWGMTNVGSDVFDFYQVKFKDRDQTEYQYDGKWRPVTMKVNEFSVKGQAKTVLDTVRYTHHGPILYSDGQTPFMGDLPVGHALTWIGPVALGNSLKGLYMINRAKSYDDYRAIMPYLASPAFNIVFASNQNDVAITSAGQLPLKWKEQGKFVLDGSNSVHDWRGWIPVEHNPYVKNPARGYVSSANQFPADLSYPYYLGWKFAPGERGIRINERLENMKQATVDSLRLLQNDNFNVEARRILPDLLKLLETDAKAKANPAYAVLAQWNLRNDPDQVAPTIFERWVRELRLAIWEDEFPSNDKKAPMMLPTRDRTWALLQKQPDSKWFDNTGTPDKIETAADIVQTTFTATVDSLIAQHGPINPEAWAWGKAKSTDIKHLVPLFKSFSRMDVINGGGPNIVNATTESGHGPSWRMVVQLDKTWPKAFGLYPGGQSGNPGSPLYDNMIDRWAKGELNELVFLKSKEEVHPKIISTLKLRK
ncbi:penicillin acylase family protein [Runella slithyformis]|uniref:Peptidase S45 penicillin amidase n=1 Tax=Runella slithyformis (strain ATCC 29530 / DSM 19594 / LMG 11500 / NCIMB 11436 / LSU 4) TaxID=761193 RepID=A0A7U4E504_RUNSL|nr:penicillin acylase family protein [Runella slithyformis]AEI47609.1 peptidase S45 penicillin amidase [Runella slithyformis DSM 19594]